MKNWKWLVGILVLVLTLFCALALGEDLSTGTESAVVSGEESEETELFQMEFDEEDGLDNKAAAEEYIRRVMNLRQVNEGIVAGAHSSTAGDRITGGDLRLYEAIEEKAELVAEGELSSTEFSFAVENLWTEGFTAEELGLSSLRSSASINAFKEYAWESVCIVMKAVVYDCPFEFYWYGNIFHAGVKNIKTSISGNRIYFRGTLLLNVAVAKEYSASNTEGTFQVNTGIGQSIQTARDNAAAIVEKNRGKSDYAKLVAYKDAICELTDYNYDAVEDDSTPYGNPWQMIYLFDGDPDTKVVCEGYSKAFKYLYDQSSFSNARVINVSGIMFSAGSMGNHMWNVVRLDGKNYIADITNSDTDSVGAYGGLFLNGYEKSYNSTYYFMPQWPAVIGYQYDDDMFVAYGEEDLALSAEDYSPSGSTASQTSGDAAARKEKVKGFVTRCYELILNRGADETGLNNWTSSLVDGTKTASEIIWGFMYSQEFTGRNLSDAEAVEILYKTMLNRESDAAGKADWISRMAAGAGYADIINGFCGSGEFIALCGEYGIEPGSVETEDPDKVKAFVIRCYKLILNRGADEDGLDSWTTALKNGSRTASEIIYGFMYSSEYTGRNLTNDVAVEILYRTMLGRESDADGKWDWVRRLTRGQTAVDIINGFCGSQEFISLCGNYGITPGYVKTSESAALNGEDLTGSEAGTEEGNEADPAETAAEETTSDPAENAAAEETGSDQTETMAEETASDQTETAAEGEKDSDPAENAAEEETGSDQTEEMLGEAVQESVMNEEKARAFVAGCYRAALDREANEAELSGWAGQIVTGEKSPDRIVRGFLFSDEFRARNLSGEETVKILYRIYMNREADPEGLAFWMAKLEEGLSLEDAVKGFAASGEFRAILKDMKK